MASIVPSQSDVMGGYPANSAAVSHEAGPSTGSSGAAMFTCLSCSIAYANPEDQRAHYRTDLHRYNMKRRVANLPPVRADVFNAKILERQTTAQADGDNAQGTTNPSSANQDRCRTCHKSFGSSNAFQSHLNSKKHKESEARSAKSQESVSTPSGDVADTDPLIVRLPQSTGGLEGMGDVKRALPASTSEVQQRPTAPMSLRVTENATEEEIEAAIDAKVASSKRIDPTRACIFCSASNFANLNDSLAHMTRFHGFFLPERDYLTDTEGLMKYLADKVCVGNICLYCNGKGRGFATGEAVRKHMIDKSHCKVAYDAEEDKLELSDFYDFTTSYPDAQWEDVSDDGDGVADDDEEMVTESEVDDDDSTEGEEASASKNANSGVRYGDNEFELILPSGARLGHRSLRRYYNQSLRPTGSAYTDSSSGSALARRLNQHDKSARDPTLVENRGGHLVRARNRGEAREAKKHISTYRDAAKREQYKTQIGYRNNMQKHFRDPLLQ